MSTPRIEDATPAQLRHLKTFLARPDIAEHALTFRQLQGFLFALACAPELVPPSEWIPVVFGEEPVFHDGDELDGVMGALMALYNGVNRGVLERGPRLPDDCALHDDPMANLEPDAPVAEWSDGFRFGHLWLEETWDVGLDEEMEDELVACVATLACFASRPDAERLWEEAEAPGMSFEDFVAEFHRLFPVAMDEYAAMGRAIYEAIYAEGHEPAPAGPVTGSPTPGRNDPCPCGSGRKLKKCCGRQVH